MTKFKFNKVDEEYGLSLTFYVDFIDRHDGTMELLTATISNGVESCDYAFVVEDRTLLEVIKDFMRGE